MELLIGCGHRREKYIFPNDRKEWSKLVTLDINPDHKPDVIWDLTKRPLPFDDNTFDEIHAYEVLEHLGAQGDWRTFFDEWSEWWRLLKPDGCFYGSSPRWDNEWTWGDPGHTRVINEACLTFLNQLEYEQVGTTPMTDYRFYYKADFEPVVIDWQNKSFIYGLRAIKPSRITDGA